MTPTHVHLMLNHVPVLGTIFGAVLLAFAIWRNSNDIKKAALGTFVVVTLFSIPVYLTGEPAAHSVESLADVSEPMIEQHEDAAAVTFTGAIIVGLGSLAGLIIYRRQPIARAFAATVLAGGLVVSILMAWTANVGGQIRHSEIRGIASPAAADHESDDDH